MSEKLIGQMIDRYQVIAQLGAGGMAAVYKAFDTRLERHVALKVILQGYQSSPEFLKRFEREAKALAQLSHPNIVSVHDYGAYIPAGGDSAYGMPYLVMEYLPGGTFKEQFGRQMTAREAARVLAPLARALGYAHQRGIIHRDVKPANVLVTAAGEPMLSDFGIARILTGDTTQGLTGTGVGIGTPAYMAPEQGLGEKVDARADIYALGVMFYEMVTGRQPYRADTPMAVMLKKASEPLPSPRQFAPHLSDAVEGVILKALARQPEHRYASMNAFGAALEKIVAGTGVAPIVETPSRSTPVGSRGVSTSGWLVGLGMLVIVMVIAALVLLMAGPGVKAPTPAPAAAQPATAEVDAPAPVTLAETAAPSAIDTLPPAPTPLPLRFSPITLDNITQLSQLAVWGQGKGVAVVYSPDGSRLAVASVVGVYVLDSTTLMTAAFIDLPSPEGVQFLGDGARLAVWKNRSVNLWDALSGGHIMTIEADLNINDFDFSADGSLLLLGGSDGQVQLWDVESGSLRQAFEPFDNGVSQVALSPGCSASGSTCYAAAGNRRWHPADEAETSLRIWSLDGTRLHSEARSVFTLVFSPDGKYLAADGRLLNAGSWTLARDLDLGEYASPKAITISPDSTKLALGDDEVMIYALESGEQLLALDLRALSLAYAPDGSRLATVSRGGDVHLWDAARGEALAHLEGFGSGAAGLEIALDGGFLAAGCGEKTCLYDVSSGGLLNTLSASGNLGLSADGGLLSINESIWRLPEGVMYNKVDAYLDHTNDYALSPDGSLLAAARGTSGKDVLVFDALTSDPLYALEDYQEAPTGLAFSPNSEILAVGIGAGGIELRQALDGALLLTIPTAEAAIDVLAFSPDPEAARLAAGQDNCQVTLWNTADGAQQGALGDARISHRLTGCVLDLSFSPDGKMLAAAVSNRVEIWQAADSVLLHTLTGHADDVTAVRFSPQGDYIASASDDGTLRLWGISP